MILIKSKMDPSLSDIATYSIFRMIIYLMNMVIYSLVSIFRYILLNTIIPRLVEHFLSMLTKYYLLPRITEHFVLDIIIYYLISRMIAYLLGKITSSLTLIIENHASILSRYPSVETVLKSMIVRRYVPRFVVIIIYVFIVSPVIKKIIA
jgi:hypothetical protein